jgi:hypothetical protein
MISRDTCQRVLQKAVSTGADYAEIYAENTVNHTISMIASKVDAIRDTVVAGNKTSDGIDLVLHQCDERRNYDCGALHYERRKLVAERLSSACRHEDKGIVSVGKMCDDPFLISLERIKTEEFLQLAVKQSGVCYHDT